MYGIKPYFPSFKSTSHKLVLINKYTHREMIFNWKTPFVDTGLIKIYRDRVSSNSTLQTPDL